MCSESTHSPMPRKIDHQSHGSEYSKSHQHRQQIGSIWCPVRKPTKQIPKKTGGKFSLFHQSWRKLLLETILKVRKFEFEFLRQKIWILLFRSYNKGSSKLLGKHSKTLQSFHNFRPKSLRVFDFYCWLFNTKINFFKTLVLFSRFPWPHLLCFCRNMPE